MKTNNLMYVLDIQLFNEDDDKETELSLDDFESEDEEENQEEENSDKKEDSQEEEEKKKQSRRKNAEEARKRREREQKEAIEKATKEAYEKVKSHIVKSAVADACTATNPVKITPHGVEMILSRVDSL